MSCEQQEHTKSTCTYDTCKPYPRGETPRDDFGSRLSKNVNILPPAEGCCCTFSRGESEGFIHSRQALIIRCEALGGSGVAVWGGGAVCVYFLCAGATRKYHYVVSRTREKDDKMILRSSASYSCCAVAAPKRLARDFGKAQHPGGCVCCVFETFSPHNFSPHAGEKNCAAYPLSPRARFFWGVYHFMTKAGK